MIFDEKSGFFYNRGKMLDKSAEMRYSSHEKLNCKSTPKKLKKEYEKMAAKVDSAKCVGCEACVGACPVGAIEMKDGAASVKESECIDCLA